MKLNILAAIFLLGFALPSLQSTEVLIIGGGPAGLATALEAYQQGMTVKLVEKEKDCLHPYWVFLTQASLSLLDKWEVTIPQMTTVQLAGQTVGAVQIKYLNNALKSRVKALGIERTVGKFMTLDESNFRAEISTLNGTVEIPYDFIVAADGAQSRVRKQLGIECDPSYQTIGAWAFFPFDNSAGTVSSEIIDQKSYFIRRITLPVGSVVSLQGVCYDPKFFYNYTIGQFREKLLVQGWKLEAEQIRSRDRNMLFQNNLYAFLQKAQAFSKEASCAILVGEAATSGSFFDCIGLNIALQTAVYAGEFFSELEKDNAYENFSRKMENASKKLLKHSAYLFSQCSS
ncbi:FAD-dependent monooxygenase [Parachlamydia sp. AcF125]|uniref:FAD-dependent oxidoreductase n=1 Tax=Parachlamydia sp. AcF125 TaxID=2795736 RepID=UPI001BD8646D|nr:FAD-dependent monooxygenase [Parachlamydia sp. AcF125]MBS4167547.1 Kynurenine 3-monooxygenase [Parachlamydia sp. AcF125]